MARKPAWKIAAYKEAQRKIYEIMDEFSVEMLTDYHWRIEGMNWWPSSKKYMTKGGTVWEYHHLNDFLQDLRDKKI